MTLRVRRLRPQEWSGPLYSISDIYRDKYTTHTQYYQSELISLIKEDTIMTDCVTPEYIKLYDSGDLPVNPMSKIEEVIRSPVQDSHHYLASGTFTGYEDGRPVQVDFTRSIVYAFGYIPDRPNLSDYATVTDDLIDKALTLASNNWGSSVDEAQAMLLVSIKEAKSTVDSLKDIHRGFFKSVKGLMGRLNKDTYQNFGEVWMGSRYAYRPMAYEAAGLVSAFTNLSGRQAWQKVNTGNKQNWEGPANSVELPVVLPNTGERLGTLRMSFKTRITVLARVGARWRPKIELNQTRARLGLERTRGSAWEMTTLSFVIDWFITMGDWLTTLDVRGLIEVRDAWKSTKVDTQVILTDLQFDPAAQFAGDQPPQNRQIQERVVYHHRAVTREPTANPLDFAGVVVDINLSPAKIVDLLFILNPFRRFFKN